LPTTPGTSVAIPVIKQPEMHGINPQWAVDYTVPWDSMPAAIKEAIQGWKR